MGGNHEADRKEQKTWKKKTPTWRAVAAEGRVTQPLAPHEGKREAKKMTKKKKKIEEKNREEIIAETEK
eukprot:1646060-Rhodomonas_salina.1